MMKDQWEVVEVVGTEQEAALICGFLESRELPVHLESLLFRQEPVTFGQLGDVRVRVPSDRADEAKRLLGELREGQQLDEGEEPPE